MTQRMPYKSCSSVYSLIVMTACSVLLQRADSDSVLDAEDKARNVRSALSQQDLNFENQDYTNVMYDDRFPSAESPRPVQSSHKNKDLYSKQNRLQDNLMDLPVFQKLNKNVAKRFNEFVGKRGPTNGKIYQKVFGNAVGAVDTGNGKNYPDAESLQSGVQRVFSNNMWQNALKVKVKEMVKNTLVDTTGQPFSLYPSESKLKATASTRNGDDYEKRQYDFLGKRGPLETGNRDHGFLEKKGYDFLGKKSYDFLGKKSYDFLGKKSNHSFVENMNIFGKNGYNFLGKKSYDFLGKRGYDFLGKRHQQNNLNDNILNKAFSMDKEKRFKALIQNIESIQPYDKSDSSITSDSLIQSHTGVFKRGMIQSSTLPLPAPYSPSSPSSPRLFSPFNFFLSYPKVPSLQSSGDDSGNDPNVQVASKGKRYEFLGKRSEETTDGSMTDRERLAAILRHNGGLRKRLGQRLLQQFTSSMSNGGRVPQEVIARLPPEFLG